ncbi:cell envelope integrity protein CreD [Alphaproteobacteria bacterium]|nr:cell envelope integrity protein CreD [Alphaproteobacteria bacterium]
MNLREQPPPIYTKKFGVKLLTLKTDYKLVERVLKYFFLIILFTFVAYFLFEILSKIVFHPFQYLLIGSSLLVFYLLLLSLSEHFSFAISYLISSCAVILQILVYTRKYISRKQLAALGLIFSSVYGYVYSNISLSEYALIVGALSLFIAISITMFVTRNVTWYKTS